MPGDIDESEWEDEADDFGDSAEDDAETADCPYCAKPIYEDAVRCPHCERYISDEDAPPARKSWLVIIGAGLCLYIAYRWITG